MVHVPYPEYRVRSHLSSIRTLYHLSFLWTWVKLCRAPRCVLLGVKMEDDSIYRGLSPVGDLNNQRPSWGRYYHLSCMTNDPIFPVGRDPMTHTSHRTTYYACTCTPVNYVASTLWLPNSWRSQSFTRISELSIRSEWDTCCIGSWLFVSFRRSRAKGTSRSGTRW